MPDDLETPTTPDHPDDDDRAGPWVKTADGQVIRLPAETRFAIEDLLDNRIEKGSDKNKQARAALADALRQERVTPGFLPLGILVRLENMFDPRMRDSVPAWLNIVPTSEPREDRDQRNIAAHVFKVWAGGPKNGGMKKGSAQTQVAEQFKISKRTVESYCKRYWPELVRGRIKLIRRTE